MDDKLKFLYLLERPTEPLYIGPKGHGTTKYLYNLPPDHLEPYQVQAMIELRKMIPPSTTLVEVPVYKTTIPYDLTKIQRAVPRNALFSEFNRNHMEASAELANILQGITNQINKSILFGQVTKDDFFNACALCRDVVNPHLWLHAFTWTVSKRPDMHGFKFPAVWEVMPDMFIEGKVWMQAIAQATFPDRERAIVVIDKNFTGTNLNPEHKVAYFAEDIAANSHHWHWHIVNAYSHPRGSVDRKSEIFYYMHHGMLARYDTERLANGLYRVVPFDIHRDLIEVGYFPKLTMQNASVNMPGRQNNAVLQDLDRSLDPESSVFGRLPLADVRAYLDRVIEAIDAGFAIQEGGGRIDLRTEQQGINVVTAMWEPSNDSPHQKYYGVPHNFGHVSIGFVHDPDFRYKEAPAAMYFTGTSMRDPVFFRWHKYLDLISQRQKDYLQPYPTETLHWVGVDVKDIQMVRMEPSHVPMPHLNPVNNMVTHWMQSDVEVSRGLDFGRSSVSGLGSVWVRTTHLQHVPFMYRIKATNQTRSEVDATVRIFMAPKLDENGDKLPFFEQRILFFEMDKFTVRLHAGENVITQKSEDSTLTIPWGQTFREIEADTARPTRAQAICNCGWPQHLLLPRGKFEGMLFDLFVMLTPTQVDQVPSSRRQLTTLTAKGTCRDSISFCGLIDDKIPDGRPMGFPFDKPSSSDEKGKLDMFVTDFVSSASNMATQEINIFHVDKTILRENGAPRNLREVHVAP